MYKLRFSESDIANIAARYETPDKEKRLQALKPNIKKRGFLKKSELEILAEWKAPRSAGHVAKNPAEYVEDVTKFALSANTERARIETLTVLDGVAWPSASVILHFFHDNKYPILDFRALWSLSIDKPKFYTFDFWVDYAEICREIARRNQITMRTLDRALWHYSKENQPKDKN